MRIRKQLNTFCFIRCAYFLTWRAHANTNIKLSFYYWTHGSRWLIHNFKEPYSTRFFIIKPRHPGRLKKQIWAENPAVGSLVTCGKTAINVAWSDRGHVKTLRTCAELSGGLAVTNLPGATRSFNPALAEPTKAPPWRRDWISLIMI